MSAAAILTLAERRAELRRIAEETGTEHTPDWRSPVCMITPHRHNNHTACDWTLCTCGCHQRTGVLF